MTTDTYAPYMGGGANSWDGILPLIIGAALFGGGGGIFGNRNNMGGPAASAVATDVVLNPAFQALGQQISTLSNQVNQSTINDSLNDLASATANGVNSINQELASIGRDYNSLFGQVNSNIASGNFTTLSSINGLGRDVTTQANQNALQQLNSFNQLNTAIFQGLNSLAMQNVTATNQIISQGTALAAQMAACCCETQKQILSDGNATRQLINDLNVQNLTAQLNDAKNSISNSNQTNALIAAMAAQTNTIISHLVPLRDRVA